jgi:hypothetical protein
MFKLDIDLDDLTHEGLDAVLSVLLDGFKGSFTSDWLSPAQSLSASV